MEELRKAINTIVDKRLNNVLSIAAQGQPLQVLTKINANVT